MDGDGDLDVVVGAFGWREVGGIQVLENRTTSAAPPVFVKREVDARQGAIHVPVTDLNGDGKPDFVGLLAQHYEAVVAYLGDGARRVQGADRAFAPRIPPGALRGWRWWTSTATATQDVLVTNGDMLDDFLLKPYHGMRWLENRGNLAFLEHELATLPGVHRALAADLDLDGDLRRGRLRFRPVRGPGGDRPDPRAAEQPRLPSLVWLEQTAAGRFERRTLERGGSHVSLDVADYDRRRGPRRGASGNFRLSRRRAVGRDLGEPGACREPAR